MSPTMLSVVSEKGRPSKKAGSDILSQVNLLNDEIESMQSERLDKENEHKFLQAECQDEHQDATIVHQCSQEAKGTEIRLHEAEAKMHESLAKAHAEEAALLHLKIQFHQLAGGS
ncbi:hypothetical protein BDR07DRAFT_1491560 [Suillus spraguei]|nr:hypothetical protein BDR07DRAFT_1491560 [Suillus spraguei]